MDDLSCGVSDIEYMLQLRRNKKIEKVNKDITANSPSFYDDDYKKYKTKHIKKLDEKELMKTNMGTFKYIFSDRKKYVINTLLSSNASSEENKEESKDQIENNEEIKEEKVEKENEENNLIKNDSEEKNN